MKRVVITLLQVVITLALLWFIFRNPEKRALMAEALRQADYGWMALGTLAISGMVIGGAERWRLLLKVQGIVLRRIRVYELFMIGLFFNLFLPGGTGGDLLKIFYTMRETSKDKKTAALLSVVIDRVVGLLALFLMALVFGAIGWKTLTRSPATATLLGTLLLIMLASLAVVVPAFVISRLGLVHKLPARLPLRTKLVELAGAFDLYGRSPKAAIAAFGISFMAHSFIILSVYCAARAFTQLISLFDAFLVVPIIVTIAALPLSIAGLGVRENLSEILLGKIYGVPGGEAVLISITSFCMITVWSIAGGIIYFFYRPPDGGHTSLKEIEREMAEAEESVESKLD